MKLRSSHIMVLEFLVIIGLCYLLLNRKEPQSGDVVREVEYFTDSIPYPVPSEPIILKKTERYYDTTAFNKALDSALAKNPDTLRKVAAPYTTEHRSSDFFIRMTSRPLQQSATLDSLWFRKYARRDSIVTLIKTQYIPREWYDTFIIGVLTTLVTILVIIGLL